MKISILKISPRQFLPRRPPNSSHLFTTLSIFLTWFVTRLSLSFPHLIEFRLSIRTIDECNPASRYQGDKGYTCKLVSDESKKTREWKNENGVTNVKANLFMLQ
jgi:hypothetical protein